MRAALPVSFSTAARRDVAMKGATVYHLLMSVLR
jgi:hypothetical protein